MIYFSECYKQSLVLVLTSLQESSWKTGSVNEGLLCMSRSELISRSPTVWNLGLVSGAKTLYNVLLKLRNHQGLYEPWNM